MGNLFTSTREKKLWIWVGVVMIAIFSTLVFDGQLVGILEQGFVLNNTFFACFLVVVATFFMSGFKNKKARDIWIFIGVIAIYITIVLRMGLTQAERTHLFEYGLLAVLIYQALLERKRNGAKVPIPEILAILITVGIGWIDEGIQAISPNRVYDIVDVFFNFVASVLAVGASFFVSWLQSFWNRKTFIK